MYNLKQILTCTTDLKIINESNSTILFSIVLMKHQANFGSYKWYYTVHVFKSHIATYTNDLYISVNERLLQAYHYS